MEARELLRFRHCAKTVYTLVPTAPAELRCPLCGHAGRFGLADAPVRIRSPIRDGHRATCCFLMTSQHGAPALTEETDSELHVGLSNSKGEVFSYTASGVQRQQQGWEHSVIVPLIAPGNSIPLLSIQWDRQLDVFAGLDQWTADRFEEQREFGSCCYGFALGFINHMMRSQGQQPISREGFTAQYVLPRMEEASSLAEEPEDADRAQETTEEEMEHSVIRLSHCHKDIFCFSVPERCPCCGDELRTTRLQEAPVSLPSPLTDGHKSSCCLLVTPADTHREFDGTSDLHTGISNTTGVVYNYTGRGVSRDQSGWERCISVPLVRPDRFHLLAQWDQYLERFSEGPMWDPTWHSFDEDNHNCFSFCLQFINSVLEVEGRQPLSRDAFTHTFILPRMTRVSKYRALTRHIYTHHYYLVDRQEDRQEEDRQDEREDV